DSITPTKRLSRIPKRVKLTVENNFVRRLRSIAKMLPALSNESITGVRNIAVPEHKMNIVIRLVVWGFAALAFGCQTIDAADAELKARLMRALSLHASFDQALDADFARGDKACYILQGKELISARPTEEVRLEPGAGRFQGALHFTKKNNFRPAFK